MKRFRMVFDVMYPNKNEFRIEGRKIIDDLLNLTVPKDREPIIVFAKYIEGLNGDRHPVDKGGFKGSLDTLIKGLSKVSYLVDYLKEIVEDFNGLEQGRVKLTLRNTTLPLEIRKNVHWMNDKAKQYKTFRASEMEKLNKRYNVWMDEMILPDANEKRNIISYYNHFLKYEDEELSLMNIENVGVEHNILEIVKEPTFMRWLKNVKTIEWAMFLSYEKSINEARLNYFDRNGVFSIEWLRLYNEAVCRKCILSDWENNMSELDNVVDNGDMFDKAKRMHHTHYFTFMTLPSRVKMEVVNTEEPKSPITIPKNLSKGINLDDFFENNPEENSDKMEDDKEMDEEEEEIVEEEKNKVDSNESVSEEEEEDNELYDGNNNEEEDHESNDGSR